MFNVGRIQGLFAIFGPGIFILVASLMKWSTDPRQLIPGALASLCIVLGALMIPTQRRKAQMLLTLGILGVLGSSHGFLAQSPRATLLFVILAGSALYLLWSSPGVDLTSRQHRIRSQVVLRSVAAIRASSIFSLGLWFLVVIARIENSAPSYGALALSFLINLGFVLRWLQGQRRQRRPGGLVVTAITGVSLLGAALLWPEVPFTLTAIAMIPAAALILIRERRDDEIKMSPAAEAFFFHPERVLILTFLVFSVLGTIALALPAASTTSLGISVIDAAFTAVSAVCVTGLVVLNTPLDFTPLGHGIILLLIQIGGLGIMTFSTATLVILGRRMSLRHEGAVAKMLGGEHRNEMASALKRIIVVTFASEAIGAVLLSMLFISKGDTPWMGIWRGIFTSISAFCNAGFVLQTNSLISYQNSPGILHVVTLLVILGSLSPLAVLALPKLIQRRAVPIQIKLIWVVTVALLVGGTLAIGTMEWRHSLAHLSFSDKIHNAWVLSAMGRSGGFNSVDLSGLQTPSLLLILALMFIGGSPGSTAGGLKTTTFAVLVLAVMSAFRGEWRIHAFNRLIPHESVYKAAAILTAVGGLGFTLLVSLHLTQAISLEMGTFEVVSALGTVGLSIGGTGKLDGIGKTLIMIGMFAGRVGPLSIFLFLANYRTRRAWKVPEEQVVLG